MNAFHNLITPACMCSNMDPTSFHQPNAFPTSYTATAIAPIAIINGKNGAIAAHAAPATVNNAPDKVAISGMIVTPTILPKLTNALINDVEIVGINVVKINAESNINAPRNIPIPPASFAQSGRALTKFKHPSIKDPIPSATPIADSMILINVGVIGINTF